MPTETTAQLRQLRGDLQAGIARAASLYFLQGRRKEQEGVLLSLLMHLRVVEQRLLAGGAGARPKNGGGAGGG